MSEEPKKNIRYATPYGVRFEVIFNPGDFGCVLRIGRNGQDGSVDGVAEPLAFRPHVSGELLGEDCGACLALSVEEVDHLIDSLWRFGFRPSAEAMLKDSLGIQAQLLKETLALRKTMADKEPHIVVHTYQPTKESENV